MSMYPIDFQVSLEDVSDRLLPYSEWLKMWKLVESDSLPEDMLTEIRTKLSVESLMTCKCVNKAWRDLISSVGFAVDHFQCNKDKPTSYLHMSDKEMQLLTEGLRRVGLIRSFMPQSNKNDRLSGSIVGCSYGLVCVRPSFLDFNFAIWNPATRKSRYISSGSRGILDFAEKRIGFDVRSCGDYRIVAILFPLGGRVSVEMYCKSSNCWENASKDGEVKVPNMGLADSSVVTLDGSMYWCMYRTGTREDRHRGHQDVACYDMWEDEYRQISGPYSGQHSGTLGIIYGSSLGYFFTGEVIFTFDGWVLNREEGTWSKHFTMIPYLQSPQPELPSDGEVEVIIFNNKVCYYHRATNKILSFPWSKDYRDAVQYKESLFSV